MPRQETFLTVKNGDETVEILKTYDEDFAKEAFRNMDDAALAHLANSLKPETLYDEKEIPKPGDEGYEDFIWDVMVDDAREDWKTFSYFVVTRSSSRRSEELFVCGDWPTAEAYVKLMGLPTSATWQNPA